MFYCAIAPPFPMLVCLQFGAERREKGGACGELKTVRLKGAGTRERFLEGGGEKAFWCRGGVSCGLASPIRRLALMPVSGNFYSLGY
jgi:hypothetical protein